MVDSDPEPSESSELSEAESGLGHLTGRHTGEARGFGQVHTKTTIPPADSPPGTPDGPEHLMDAVDLHGVAPPRRSAAARVIPVAANALQSKGDVRTTWHGY